MLPPDVPPDNVRRPPAGPPDPEFDWMLAPVLHALGPQGEQEPLRSAVALSQQRFLEMAGRVDLSVHTRAQQESRRDAQDRIRIAQLQQEFAALDVPLQSLMDRAVQRTRELLHADGVTLELVQDDGVLMIVAGCGLLAERIGRRANMAISLTGKALAQRRVMVCDDTILDDRLDRERALGDGVRSMVIAPLRSGEAMIGVLLAAYAEPHAFYDRDIGNLQILGESLGVTIDRHRLHAQLRAAAEKYRALFDLNPQPMFVTELSTLRVMAVNRSAAQMYGYHPQELIGRPMTDLRAPDETAPRMAMPGDSFSGLRLRHRHRNGHAFDVEVSGTTIDFDGRPARLVRSLDVSARLRAEAALARVSRAQHVLSACNESLVRATSEQSLLEELCRIAVDIGGYAMAWVGFAREDAHRSVEAAAKVGDPAGYIGSFPLSWAADEPAGQGPVGLTIRTGQLMIVPDVETDPRCRRWAHHALAHGFRGLVCLPLRDGERTFGLFYLYLNEVATPTEDEVALLKALADDLAFGLVNLRAREQQRLAQEAQQRVQTAMLKVAAAVSASTGTEFFEQLALNMADALGAQASFIAMLEPGGALVARTLGAVVHGQVRRNFDAPLAGSRLAGLLDRGAYVVSEGVAEAFAPYPLLAAIGAQAYAGHSLFDAGQRVIGLVLVAFSEPLRHQEFLGPTLRIFAVRVAAELDRRKADEHSRHQASLLDKARDAIVVADMACRVQYWNKSAERLYGWRADEAMDQSVATLLFEDEATADHAQAELMGSGEWNGEVARRRKAGQSVQVEARWTLVRDDQGAPRSILMIDTDITQRKQAEAKIQKLAFYDGLTSLPNRQLLQDRLHKALAGCVRHRAGGALLCMDLDNFKTLNDTLGHDKGDMLLQQVAMRLVSCVREVDTVARLGGDEFVIVLEELSAVPEEVAVQARKVGEKILATLAQPYRLDGYEHQSTASIGVARFGADTESAGELLKQADIAMYQAKAAGRHTLRFFDPGLEAAVTARAALEGDLRQAFVQREFFLQYQPQVDSESRITGVEALVRWRHAARGLVSPAEFIPLAEETGLILLLGHRVLEIACTQLADWGRQPALAALTMAVNVSARQFRHPDFVRQVRSVLEQTGADPQRLKLELTESVLVDDMQAIVAKMGALKDLGVRFALDDFGTGYSSLTYLKKLPLDQLKIDQSFVRDVLVDANDAAIARTVIRLAQSLGLNVIAEGVETAGQRDFLASEGCEAFQGYFFSRPLAADALDRLLRQQGVAGA
ncbi:EAL domain-containing protein [Pseudorhodoferax sp. Leaf274]|uniref:EAL domain-containing protein n=1 Tax=Pseudorhodoferax sp. Leaf274 TaxID=1736318 RepID=UPI001F265F64|nr:EAL domain-containing protein [Pseudorhodoferax sp. Leaf274]